LSLRSRNVDLVGGHKSREKTILLRLDQDDKRTDEQLLERLKKAMED